MSGFYYLIFKVWVWTNGLPGHYNLRLVSMVGYNQKLAKDITRYTVVSIVDAVIAGIIKRTFWILVVMATIGALTYNLAAIGQLFFSYPVAVTIDLVYNNDMLFPAVTVCNMSPIKKSAYNDQMLQTSRRKKRSTGGQLIC